MNRIVRIIAFLAFPILLPPAIATGQYLYLDTDGDGAHTSADVVNPTGTTTVGVWLKTDGNRDGSAATCDTDDGPLSIGGYEFILRASNGTVTWGPFTNEMTSFINGIDSTSDDQEFHGAANGSVLPPGLYHLATVRLSVVTGTPGVTVERQSHLRGTFLTGFGSQCSGLDFSNTLTLGTDWFDTDGLPFGGAANHPPTLDPIPGLSALEATVLEQPLTARDEDGDPLQFTKRTGPRYLTVSTTDPGTGIATGVARLAPEFTDAGTTSASIEVTDGLASAQADVPITVLNQDRAPILEQPQDMTVLVGFTASQELRASDPDNDVLQFTLVSAQDFVKVSTVSQFYPATGRLDVAPDGDDTGVTRVTVGVSDGTLSAEQTLEIYVVGGGQLAPLFCRPYDMTVVAGSQAEQTLMAEAIRPAPLTFLKVSGPAFAEVTTLSTTEESQTGLLRVAPTSSDLGEHALTIGVSDGSTTTYGALLVTVVERPVPKQPAPERFTTSMRAYEVGAVPQAVVVTDLNEDGIPDVVSPNQRCGISVLLGLGGGSFASRVDYHLDGEPMGADAADLDMDGHVDVAVAAGIGDAVAIFKGDGTGALVPFQVLAAGLNVTHVAAGDLNRDGIPDLVAALMGENSILVYLGVGGGNFASPVRYASGVQPCFTLIRDLNGDGIPDLSETCEASDAASIYLGHGDGSFTSQVQYRVAEGPTAVDAADLDGDGNVDLLVPGFHTTFVSVLFGDGSGAFPRRQDFPVGRDPWSACIADVNEDSHLDLISANTLTDNVSVLLGRGDGTFQSHIDFPAGRVPRYVACAQLTADRHLDLAVADEGSGYVSILRGNGDGTFGNAATLDTGLNPRGMAIADWTGDGRADIAAIFARGQAISLFRGTGGGSFAPPVAVDAGSEPNQVVAADMNGDGVTDLVAPLSLAGAIAIVPGGPTFGTTAPTLLPVAADPLRVTVGDWNRDGRLDLAAVCEAAHVVTLLYGAADGSFSRTDLSLTDLADDITSGDWNGDGYPDLAVNPSGSAVLVFWGGPSGFTEGQTMSEQAEDVTLGSGDLDRDGREELIVCLGSGPAGGSFSFQQGLLLVWSWPGTSQVPNERMVPSGLSPGHPFVADVTNDGLPDVVLTELIAGLVDVFPGRGDRTLAGREVYGGGVGTISSAVGDVDGDGRLDLVTANFGGNSLTILRNVGPKTVAPLAARAFPQTGDRVIRLVSDKPTAYLQLEPAQPTFSATDIDPATLRLARVGSSAAPIATVVTRRVRIADTDRNGVAEFPACFAKADLRQLFSDVRGDVTVACAVTGSLVDGRTFRADLALEVVGAPGGTPLAARVWPNPMNPVATLTFTTGTDGPARVILFDVRGRVVARVFDARAVPAGAHEVLLGGSAGRPGSLASGIYFYRVETAREVVSGRFTVLK